MHSNYDSCPACPSGRLMPITDSSSSYLRCVHCGICATQDDVVALEIERLRDWIPPNEREDIEWDIAQMFRV